MNMIQRKMLPGHILAFATGSSKVPAIGFQPAPKITFIHDESKHLPIAHTCANELQLFVNETTMADDDAFHYSKSLDMLVGNSRSSSWQSKVTVRGAQTQNLTATGTL
uniref:HECT domain-containing protein n=1 Tax=Maylandia zebra TaxID=106582 RepID=A0A3P9BGG6_9CICH